MNETFLWLLSAVGAITVLEWVRRHASGVWLERRMRETVPEPVPVVVREAVVVREGGAQWRNRRSGASSSQ